MGKDKSRKRRKRGEGSLTKRGGVWHYALTLDGHTERKTTGCTNRDDAAAHLRDRIAEIKREGTKTAFVRPEKVTVELIVTTLRNHYRDQGKASSTTIGGIVKAWEASAFWKQDANDIRFHDLDRQALAWRSPTLSNATINRRLSFLRAAYHFARKKLGLTYLPEFPRLPENGRLTDKYGEAEIAAICAHLPQDHADVFQVACAIGVRKGQLLATTASMVDPDSWKITWPAEVCKRRESHTVALTGTAKEIVMRRYSERRLDQPLLFHRDGKPLYMRDSFKKAVLAAGLPYGRGKGKVFHGSRRTAATNLAEAGIDRSIAKSITGHSTDSMYQRYCITEGDAQREALQRVEAHRAAQSKKSKVIPMQKGAA